MEVVRRPEYLKTPKNPWNIKIANLEGLGELYEGSTGESFECHCGKRPQTVCKECLAYLCEDHLYRHPDCEAGR